MLFRSAGQANAQGAAAITAVMDAFTEIRDFGEENRLKSERRKVIEAADVEFAKRMQLTSDHRESFYNSDETLNQVAVESFIKGYTNQLDDVQGSFIDPANEPKDKASLMDMRDNFTSRIFGKVAMEELGRARGYVEENMQLALENGDYDTYDALVEVASAKGFLSSTQAELLKTKARKRQVGEYLQNVIATDPGAASRMLADGEFDDVLSDFEKAQ